MSIGVWKESIGDVPGPLVCTHEGHDINNFPVQGLQATSMSIGGCADTHNLYHMASAMFELASQLQTWPCQACGPIWDLSVAPLTEC